MGACGKIITDSKLNSYNNTFSIEAREVCILTNGVGTAMLIMNPDKFGCRLYETPEIQKGVSNVKTPEVKPAISNPSQKVSNSLPIQPPETPSIKDNS